MKLTVLLLAVLLLVARTASAQIVNPTAFLFDSPDQTTLDGAGLPILTSYSATLTPTPPVGTAQILTVPIAKTLVVANPTPTAAPCSVAIPCPYQVLFSSLPPLLTGVTYTAGLVAIGPGGSSAIDVSVDSFLRPDPAPRAGVSLHVR